MLFFDVESDGLLDTATKIHCLVTINNQGQVSRYRGESVEEGIKTMLSSGEVVCGHNVIDFDLPLIEKLFGIKFPINRVLDTLLIARLRYPEMGSIDAINRRRGKPTPEGKLYGTHKLEAWGIRLGLHKGDFGKTTDWKEWSQEMEDYCELDVKVTMAVFKQVYNLTIIPQATLDLEHEFASYISWQMREGAPFDTEEANRLLAKVNYDYDKLYMVTCSGIPDFVNYAQFTPKVNNKARGYVKGETITKVNKTAFNPNSRQHIVRFFKEKYNWVPVELTETGEASVAGDVLRELPYPEAKQLALMLDMAKLRGQLATGENSWLNYVKDNKIHGYVNTCGALTRRCTHAAPNLAQVPTKGAYMGLEARDLFKLPRLMWDTHRIVGADAAALELRIMAHYLYPYDNGVFRDIVLTGDVHTNNQQMAGLPTRDNAKTFIYAFIYGAGDEKLGLIVNPSAAPEEAAAIGAAIRVRFLRNFPALDRLINDVKGTFKNRGYIKALDGGWLVPRGAHSALNTLFQSAGALVMKKAVCLHRPDLERLGGWPILNIHDEAQHILPVQNADESGRLLVSSITQAGAHFKLACPMNGNYKVGISWKETH